MKLKSIATTALALATSVAALAGSTTAGAAGGSTTQSITPTQQISSTAKAVPIRGDFDGDGRDDVFFYVPGSGADTLWSGKGRSASPSAATADRFDVQTINISGTYTPVAGDFNGDGRDDIFWYGVGSAADSVWYFTGRGTATSKSTSISGTYTPVVANFNASGGNSTDDILWYSASTTNLWSGNTDNTFTGTSLGTAPKNAKVYVDNWRQSSMATNAPVYQDVLFYVPGTGADAIWTNTSGIGTFTSSPVTINGSYDPIIGNFDATTGPETADVFWYAPGKLADSVWMNTGSGFVNVPATTGGKTAPVAVNGASYKPVTIPAKTAGQADKILWNNPSGSETIWNMTGSANTFAYDVINLSDFGATDPGARAPLVADYDTQAPVQGATTGSVAVGRAHSCAITSTKGVKCWGANNLGQLGNGTNTASTTPVDVTGLTNVTSIASGADSDHTCAVTGGAVKCWGSNSNQQLGVPTISSSNVPVSVTSLSSGMTAVSTGLYHTCALTSTGGVKCWGSNNNGQLGNGGAVNDVSTPVDVTGITSGATSVSSGYRQSCAVTSAGGVKCWGNNASGQLGFVAANGSGVPQDVTGLTSGVASVASGDTSTCAVTTSGGAKCWGLNQWSQLGNGGTTNSTAPVDVVGLTSGVAAIAPGNNHSCALTTAGGVKCWGAGGRGQIGQGATLSVTVPTDVQGLTSGVSTLSAGYDATCALVSGSTKCWGANDVGQLGNASTVNTNAPVSANGGAVFATGITDAGTAASTDILWWAAGNTDAQTEQVWLELESL